MLFQWTLNIFIHTDVLFTVVPCIPHGNSNWNEKFSRHFVQINVSALAHMDPLTQIISRQIYSIKPLNESGRLLLLTSPSMEQRGVSHVINMVKKR